MRFETKLLIDPEACWINFKQRTERRVLMWFSHTFSVASNFLMAMSRVQNVPAIVKLIRLVPGT